MSVKRYEVNGSSSVFENENGSLVDYEDYAALEARCAALAAENAGLKEWSPNPHSASMFEAIEKAEKLMDDGMPELAMVEAFEILKMKRTPATDAFLAEVRASAVDEACLKISNAIVNCYQDEQIGLDEAATICGDFASELRKGVQS
ncbi:TPA: hypothetical protein LTW92_001989 [Enterobacter cloacae]|nr:hypothetical protein [Enterobacter cloacae]